MKKVRLLGIWLAISVSCLPTNALWSFAFIFANYTNGLDTVPHPTGYTGVGGIINVTVGVDPTSLNAADMLIPVENAVQIYNSLTPTTGNVTPFPASGIAFSEMDFESVFLHELGHSLGLAHPNLATESGVPAVDRNYTKTEEGIDGFFSINDGADNVIGSADDLRGDDDNLHYFRINSNNPFTIPATVDQTTYSQGVANLPVGDLFPANADRDVAGIFGFPNTECVMQQGSFFGEIQRTLGHDDVAGIRYGMAGVDEIAGTGDDYTLNLIFAGLDASADIVVDFDNSVSFATSFNGGVLITGNHIEILNGGILFNDGFDWFFNTVPLPVEWVQFSATPGGPDVLLQWTTTGEENVKHFDLQRSIDGEAWHPVARMENKAKAGVPHTNYRFHDANAQAWGNHLFYRVQQVDLDGNTYTSEVRSVQFSFEEAQVFTFGPVPVRSYSYLDFFLHQPELLTFTLRNQLGQEVHTWNIQATEGRQKLTIGDRILSQPKGTYLLEVSSPSLSYRVKFTH